MRGWERCSEASVCLCRFPSSFFRCLVAWQDGPAFRRASDFGFRDVACFPEACFSSLTCCRHSTVLFFDRVEWGGSDVIAEGRCVACESVLSSSRGVRESPLVTLLSLFLSCLFLVVSILPSARDDLPMRFVLFCPSIKAVHCTVCQIVLATYRR